MKRANEVDGCSATLAGGDVETYDGLVDGEEEERVLVERAEAEGDAVLARVVARDLRQFGVAASVEPERRLVARLLRPEPRPPNFHSVIPSRLSFQFFFSFPLPVVLLRPKPRPHSSSSLRFFLFFISFSGNFFLVLFGFRSGSGSNVNFVTFYFVFVQVFFPFTVPNGSIFNLELSQSRIFFN